MGMVDVAQTELDCIPVALSPDKAIAFVRCEAVPGVTVARASKDLKAIMREMWEKSPIQPGYSPTHVILIDRDRYLSDLSNRLKAEGGKLPDRKKMKPWGLSPSGSQGQ